MSELAVLQLHRRCERRVDAHLPPRAPQSAPRAPRPPWAGASDAREGGGAGWRAPCLELLEVAVHTLHLRLLPGEDSVPERADRVPCDAREQALLEPHARPLPRDGEDLRGERLMGTGARVRSPGVMAWLREQRAWA
jgi:hypothetical protein